MGNVSQKGWQKMKKAREARHFIVIFQFFVFVACVIVFSTSVLLQSSRVVALSPKGKALTSAVRQ